MLKEQLYMKLKDKDLGNYYPIFDKDKYIIKEYGNGFVLALPDHQEISLNETLMEVLGMCTGKSSVNDIVKKMLDMYDVEVETAESDLVKVLHDTWGIGIVTWKDDNNLFHTIYSYSPNEDTKYEISEFQNLIQYLETFDEGALYNSSYKRKVKYCSTSIEEAVNKAGTLYFEYKKNDKVLCLMGYTPKYHFKDGVGKVLYYSIDYLYINKDETISNQQFEDFIKWTISFRDEKEPEIHFELILDSIYEKDAEDVLAELNFENLGSVLDDVYYKRTIK